MQDLLIMLPGNGKFERTGIGSETKSKEATHTAFNYLKANSNRISGSISTTTKDYIVNYQDLQGIGMTDKLALPTLIALASIALGKPTISSLAVLGEISIAGTMIKVDELANALQVCLDSGAKKVLYLRGLRHFVVVHDLRLRQIQLIGSLDVCDLLEDAHKLREVEEFAEPRPRPVARPLGSQLHRRDRLTEVRRPGVEVAHAEVFERVML